MVKVLIVGGTGYLGQFLVQHLSRNRNDSVAFTYNSSLRIVQDLIREATLGGGEGAKLKAYQVDLCTGEGLDQIEEEPHLVINTAAVSQPRVCEEKPEFARSVNVPTKLISHLRSTWEGRPTLVHFSTDHVYKGCRAFNKETEVLEPVNAYGLLKKDAEDYLSNWYPKHLVFRSSIIYGPGRDVSRNLFLQWMDQALGSNDQAIDFYQDEFRCPIYVMDIVKLMRIVLEQSEKDSTLELFKAFKIFNLGGPTRLSRFEMAKMLCEHRSYSVSNCIAATRPKHVKAPLDASMDITRMRQAFAFEPTPFKEALCEIFQD